MKFRTYSHRYGIEIISTDSRYNEPYRNLLKIIESITDQEIINRFQHRKYVDMKSDTSISHVINGIFKEKLRAAGWHSESRIFKEKVYSKGATDWRLDFTYNHIYSLEIAFNHASATCVNLLKPVLASELNHVEKEFKTELGLIITATDELKKKGRFDNAIGSFEGYTLQCIPMMNQLTVPMVIIGLEAPETFELVRIKEGQRNIGHIKLLSQDRVLDAEHYDNEGKLVKMLLY
ncbi:hypothetical protein ERX27_02445 [Macrococcus brunensis]|uniref:Restriction endonuclease n=1 Tax=Macrococcus brunensis TaxID=198483 RepID=A0A4V3BDJ5_9STAP|nr:hypothetical protein [Macrococcus brunensis]TDL98656.1 hypothetical protein ERX27_02445 [Macrococcus brunensis]